jgi:aconitate hydratase
VVIGGDNYGQGSSREHAALAPRYLGVRVKIAKSFARIHKANLCNFGILPLVFKDPSDYDKLEKGSGILLEDIRSLLESNKEEIPVKYGGGSFITLLDVSERQRKYLLAGGALNYVKEKIG